MNKNFILESGKHLPAVQLMIGWHLTAKLADHAPHPLPGLAVDQAVPSKPGSVTNVEDVIFPLVFYLCMNTSVQSLG